MSRVRADDIPIETDEPFGMGGISPWMKPLFAIVCVMASIACILMSGRSWTHWDGVRRDAPNSQMFLESLLGRIQFQVAAGETSRLTSDYNVYEYPITARTTDSWEPSWSKTLGLDWGDSQRLYRSRPAQSVWQVRLRWRTLALLCAVPPAIAAINVVRRRRARRAGQDV